MSHSDCTALYDLRTTARLAAAVEVRSTGLVVGAAPEAPKVKSWAASPAAQGAGPRRPFWTSKQVPGWLAGDSVVGAVVLLMGNCWELVTVPPVGSRQQGCCRLFSAGERTHTAVGTAAAGEEQDLVAGGAAGIEVEAGVGLGAVCQRAGPAVEAAAGSIPES